MFQIKKNKGDNYSSYFSNSNINRPYNLRVKSTFDLGTMFYTVKMKTINFLNHDYITENSFDYYA